MKSQGHPLRFLVLVLGGWVMLRAAMLWPGSIPVERVAPRAPVAQSAAPHASHLAAATFQQAIGDNPVPSAAGSPRKWVASTATAADPQRIALALLAMIRFGAAEPTSLVSAGPPVGVYPAGILAPASAARGPQPSRWSGSFWLIARDGRGLGASLSGSQLGGSQTGLRVAYAIGAARRVALVGRIASPLSGAGQEGAIGVEWRPTRLPVRLVAEQRIGINGAAGGPSIGVVGGVGPLPIGNGFRLEGYGQAGIIKRDGVIGFADGAVRINRQIAMIGDSPVDLGGGGWGAVQPGAARFDLGPSIGTRVLIGDGAVRVSLDWRQRLAGDARPGSGPALSIGTDF